MGLNPWWLDLWATMAVFSTAIGIFFAILGVAMVAMEGRKGWPSQFTYVVLVFPVMGILFPFILIAFPFVALYRVVTDK